MRKQLIEFFHSPRRNAWVELPQMKVYLRKGFHLGSDRQVHKFLDIAAVEVAFRFQRQGVFKAFLALCQQIQPYDGLLIECILNEDLRAYLRRLAQADPRWTERGEDFLWENEANSENLERVAGVEPA